MPTYKPQSARSYDLHGACFNSYVSPARGSAALCAWRTEITGGTAGTAHTVSDEEVFLVLDGSPTITIDGEATELAPDDVVLVPAGATLRIDNAAPQTARFWVTARSGITATTPGGDTIRPPWTV
jgi:mannose-6-phosphate isomerase-like protein (cupin superfamily)